MRDDENDHVQVHEVRGFISDDVFEAFQEAEALSKGTKCSKFLFSLSLSPPKDANVSTDEFEKAINKAEQALGLNGQPRAIVFHEKGDHRDRHAHVVWSRIDSDEMKAIDLPFNRMKMRDVSRDLFIQHGWDVPRGLINSADRNPLNYTFEQYQHAKRVGSDARTIKSAIQDAWASSDNKATFQHALSEKGFALARGDRRGFVALDTNGEAYSIPKWLDIKTKRIRERLGEEKDLPSVAEAKREIGNKMLGKMTEYEGFLNKRDAQRQQNRQTQRRQLVQQQRVERSRFHDQIKSRQEAEAVARQSKFRKGLAGAWDFIRGENKRIKSENESEALRAKLRDQIQLDGLIMRQRNERLKLAQKVGQSRDKLRSDYASVAQDKTAFKAMANTPSAKAEFKRKRRSTSERSPRPRATRTGNPQYRTDGPEVAQ
ncbi:MAG: relaxase [Pseudomonadota bacterium]